MRNKITTRKFSGGEENYPEEILPSSIENKLVALSPSVSPPRFKIYIQVKLWRCLRGHDEHAGYNLTTNLELVSLSEVSPISVRENNPKTYQKNWLLSFFLWAY